MTTQEIVASLRMTLSGWWPPTNELESYGQHDAQLLSIGESIIALFSGAQPFALGVIGEYRAPLHFRRTDRRTDAVGAITESVSDSVAANSFGSGA